MLRVQAAAKLIIPKKQRHNIKQQIIQAIKTRTEGIKTEQTPNKNKQRNATLSSPIFESSQAKTKETADEV